ncbi:hypothetical protein [Microbulbifer sp. JTAC008]|uniref:hypothetical protein n=1 Tax=unclassified Microbulbifer TaxID=2619833 RepID=UPI004039AC88
MSGSINGASNQAQRTTSKLENGPQDQVSKPEGQVSEKRADHRGNFFSRMGWLNPKKIFFRSPNQVLAAPYHAVEKTAKQRNLDYLNDKSTISDSEKWQYNGQSVDEILRKPDVNSSKPVGKITVDSPKAPHYHDGKPVVSSKELPDVDSGAIKNAPSLPPRDSMRNQDGNLQSLDNRATENPQTDDEPFSSDLRKENDVISSCADINWDDVKVCKQNVTIDLSELDSGIEEVNEYDSQSI